ncbi:MAG TPA: hypothetical protein VHB50_15085 [Bryobacteraceae bacterium]|nr:hypothetical protein [Bryobacteraceae bacterium]
MIELLFAGGEDEVRSAIDAFENAILKFGHGTILEWKRRSGCHSLRLLRLFDFAAALFAIALARQRRLDPFFLSRLQIERVALDFFNDVFLLHLPLEATKGIFQCFALLESYFSQ